MSKLTSSFLALAFLASPCFGAEPEVAVSTEAPSTYCRFVPERSDDFAWENDLVAFRVYGPALAKGQENSGIDCWAKRVAYPIVDKWYRLNAEQKLSYHADRGEGCDFYHVGKSRGCGGTAIWSDNAMVLSGVYKSWKILETTKEKSVFQLNYEYRFGGRTVQEVKTITVELGKRLFKSESVFTENEKPADLEIAIGITTHDGKGIAAMNREKGWISVWEVFGKNEGLGTGAALPPSRVTGMEEIRSEKRDESHVIVRTRTDAEGRTVHYAGFAWAKAGDFTTPEQWEGFLNNVALY